MIKLEKYLIDHKITPNKLSILAGINGPNMHSIIKEKRHIKGIQLNTAIKICKALNITLEQLVELGEKV